MKNWRLGTVILLGLGFGLIFPSVSYLLFNLEEQRSKMQAELDVAHERALEILSLGLAEPLWNIDHPASDKLATAMFKDQRYVKIVIRTTDGAAFVEKTKAVPNEQSITTRTTAIYREGKEIGTVEVAMSKHEMEQTLKDSFASVVRSTALQAFVSLLIVYLILRFKVLSPIDRLVTQARRLSRKELDEATVWQTRDELGELGSSLEFARSQLKQLFLEIEAKNNELLSINSTLEKTVEERTATITMILDHVQAGFLLCDERGVILDGFTRSCQRLFGREVKAGLSLAEMFRLTHAEASVLELAIEQVFTDFLPESVTLSQLPRRYRLDNRVISLEGTTVRRPSDNAVRFILFTLLDVTLLEQAERENQRSRALVSIIHQHDAFASYVLETKESFGKIRSALTRDEQAGIRAELHTLKGNAYAFGLVDFAKLCHQIEDETTIKINHIDKLEGQFRSFLDDNHALIGIDYDSQVENNFHIRFDEISALFAFLKSGQVNDEAAGWISNWVEKIMQTEAERLLGPVPEYAQSLAERLGKHIEVCVEGGNIRMHPETVLPVMRTLTHMIRNSIDHGIEHPFARQHKPEKGRILIRFQETETNWSIQIEDDGQGIDVQKLRSKAKELGVKSAAELAVMSDDEICMLIFSGKLSTTEDVSEVSGRGVGMSAVLYAIQEVGGALNIKNAPAHGLTFTLEIPKPQIRNGKDMRAA